MVDAACPKCDIKDPLSLAIGAISRFGHDCPTPDEDRLARLRKFVQRRLPEVLTPIGPGDVPSVEEWIESRPYTEKEKLAKLEAWRKENEIYDWEKENGKNRGFKMFMKEEYYSDWKHGRAINGPEDVAKVGFGPFLSPVEEALFSRPEFIKKIPVDKRPDYILQRFGSLQGGQFVTSDYSYYEASFTQEVKTALEFELLDYMWRDLPEYDDLMEAYVNWSSSDTFTKNKNFKIFLESVRMSGESTTSLANGFSNWMVAEFLAFENGVELVAVFEGDDGLLWFSKNTPTAADYASLGFDIKLELHDTLETTSFCGQVFAEEDRAVLTDPRYVLVTLGWAPAKYVGSSQSTLLSLLRAKSWSYGYQYQATPIISAMARCYLRLTASYDPRKALKHMDLYQRERLLEAFKAGRPELNSPVGMASRLLMEQLYGVSVEVQLRYEQYFDTLQAIEPIPRWFDVPQCWLDYSAQYVAEGRVGEVPPETWLPSYPVTVPFRIKARFDGMQNYIDDRARPEPSTL